MSEGRIEHEGTAEPIPATRPSLVGSGSWRLDDRAPVCDDRINRGVKVSDLDADGGLTTGGLLSRARERKRKLAEFECRPSLAILKAQWEAEAVSVVGDGGVHVVDRDDDLTNGSEGMGHVPAVKHDWAN